MVITHILCIFDPLLVKPTTISVIGIQFEIRPQKSICFGRSNAHWLPISPVLAHYQHMFPKIRFGKFYRTLVHWKWGMCQVNSTRKYNLLSDDSDNKKIWSVLLLCEQDLSTTTILIIFSSNIIYHVKLKPKYVHIPHIPWSCTIIVFISNYWFLKCLIMILGIRTHLTFFMFLYYLLLLNFKLSTNKQLMIIDQKPCSRYIISQLDLLYSNSNFFHDFC